MNTEDAEILLVEDSVSDIALAMHAFKTANLANSIRVARDGVEAVDFIFGKGASPANFPAVVLLDLKLPRLDGHEVLKRIKGDMRTCTIPVVVLTASAEERDVLQTYQAGVNSNFVKPIDFEQFTESIRNVGKYWLEINHLPGDRH